VSVILWAAAGWAACQPEQLLYGRTRTGAQQLLLDCRAAGQGELTLELLTGPEPRPNAFGEYALGYGGQEHQDLSLPNPAFFQHLDWLLKQAWRRRIVLAIVVVGGDASWLGASRPEVRHEFGRFLARRYRAAKGLVWLRSARAESREIEAGLRLEGAVVR
jgi:hypothetical protein